MVGLGPCQQEGIIDVIDVDVFRQNRPSNSYEFSQLKNHMLDYSNKYRTNESVLGLNNNVAAYKAIVAVNKQDTTGHAIGWEYAQGFISEVFGLITKGSLSSRNAHAQIDPQLILPTTSFREMESFFKQENLISCALSGRLHPQIFPKTHEAI